jgi:signal transduction histidine kinase
LAERYESREFVSAEQVLEESLQCCPDVIISDLMMDGVDGYELCARVRREERLRNVPIILLTSKNDEESRAVGLEVGADDYLHKPVRARELLARVESLVRLRRSIQALELRTAQLEQANKELQTAQQALVQAEKLAAIGTLAAGVAHEINNPLAFVASNLEYVSTELKPLLTDNDRIQPAVAAEVQAALKDARLGATRVARIVKDLKSFSRMSTEDDRGPIDVNQVMESSIGMVRARIKHRANLAIELKPVPPIWGSANRLGQVFLNLLVNASDAIPEGQSAENTVSVRTKVVADKVSIEIEDSGTGMPEQVKNKIFDPFFTTKPVGSGTGLGLSICHGLVKDLGGEIQVESTQGRGSLFRVLLPATASNPASAHPSNKVEPPQWRLLLIDDDDRFLSALKRSLGKNHSILVANNAADALTMLAANEIDWIICDLMMPEMTGEELYRRLEREQPTWAKKMVFMTGGTFTPRANEFLAKIRDQTLTKPFDNRELDALLSQRTPQNKK